MLTDADPAHAANRSGKRHPDRIETKFRLSENLLHRLGHPRRRPIKLTWMRAHPDAQTPLQPLVRDFALDQIGPRARCGAGLGVDINLASPAPENLA